MLRDIVNSLTISGGYIPRNPGRCSKSQVDHENCFGKTKTGSARVAIAGIETETQWTKSWPEEETGAKINCRILIQWLQPKT